MNIVVCGLSAAGKTTHSLLIASQLGYDYFSASSLMLLRLGIKTGRNNSTWTMNFQRIERLRDVSPTDEEVNVILRQEIQDRTHTVFDSWAAPWLTSGPSMRIWIESSLESRAWKARISQEPYGPFFSIDQCKSLLKQKDDATAERLAPLIQADIRTDRSVFDVILDNSDLISAPTIAAARRSISKFHELLMNEVASRLSPEKLPDVEDGLIY